MSASNAGAQFSSSQRWRATQMPVVHKVRGAGDVALVGIFMATPQEAYTEGRSRKEALVILIEWEGDDRHLQDVVSWAMAQGTQEGHLHATLHGHTLERRLFLVSFWAAEFLTGRAERVLSVQLTIIPDFEAETMGRGGTLRMNACSQYAYAVIAHTVEKEAKKHREHWGAQIRSREARHIGWAAMARQDNWPWLLNVSTFLWPTDAYELAATTRTGIPEHLPEIRIRAKKVAAKRLEHCTEYWAFKEMLLRALNDVQDIVSFNELLNLVQVQAQSKMSHHWLEILEENSEDAAICYNWAQLMGELGYHVMNIELVASWMLVSQEELWRRRLDGTLSIWATHSKAIYSAFVTRSETAKHQYVSYILTAIDYELERRLFGTSEGSKGAGKGSHGSRR